MKEDELIQDRTEPIRICLMNKKVAESNEYMLAFMDGSSVNIGTQTVTNKGFGEIIIKDLPMWSLMIDIFEGQQSFEDVKSMVYLMNINQEHWGRRSLGKLTHDIDQEIRETMK